MLIGNTDKICQGCYALRLLSGVSFFAVDLAHDLSVYLFLLFLQSSDLSSRVLQSNLALLRLRILLSLLSRGLLCRNYSHFFKHLLVTKMLLRVIMSVILF